MDGVLFTLVVGSYLFTAWVYRTITSKLDRLVNNHLRHLERTARDHAARLERLERHR